VALLRPNASGKSTLFRQLFGLLKGRGEVRATGARSPRPICYMPQDTGANAVLTVCESVLLARMQGRGLKVDPNDPARMGRTLAYLGIPGLTGRNIGDLRGGQRQLVSAAQAIVQEPEILPLDEPTSALDLHRHIGLLALLRRLARERGVLVMAALHDLGHALRFTDKAIVLQDGRLVACGVTEAVVTPALLRTVYGVEARIEPCSKDRPQIIVEACI
jgi:iron complex transport system ATP-binding protein